MTAREAGVENSGYVSIQNLNHRYAGADHFALREITLNIARGSTFGLLGPNGAGKSTLLSILTGILSPQSGRVSIAGYDLSSELAAIKSKSALVPQEYAFYPSLTGRENLQFFAGLYRLSKAQWQERLEKCVTICRLQDVLGQRAEEYSGGLKRRLNMAIGLLADPALLYLDEPTVGIDAVSRGYILEAIGNLKGHGTTIVYTSHYMEEVEALCDTLAVIDHGQVIAFDQVSRLLNKQDSQLIRIVSRDVISPSTLSALNAWSPQLSGERQLTLNAPIAQLDRVLHELSAQGIEVTQLQYGVSRLHDVYLKLLEDRA